MTKVVAFLLILFSSFILWRCASQTTPTGGPKDAAPPVLKKSTPTNKQTNFKEKVVELTFDELLKLNNPKEEIIITPTPGKDIEFTVKQNKIFIEPKDGWADTTTYSISFREGIQDLNEGNPAENLHLAFSTGPTIDSLQITGKITESLSEKIPEKITVALYQEDTFDIFLHTPAFFTKTKEDGSFKLENLKNGNYYVYAFDDKNKNLKVESKNEKFGFFPEPISSRPVPTKKKPTDTLKLALYQIDSRPLKISSIRNTGTISQIRLNKEVTSYTIDNPQHAKIKHSFSENQSEILIYHQLELNDSIPLSFTGTDSLALKIDTTFYIKRIESKLPKEKFTMKILSSTINPETFAVLVKAKFSKPIKSIDYDSIYLSPDPIPERTPKPKPGQKNKDKDKKEDTKKIEKKDTLPIKADTTTLKKDTVVKKKLLKIPVLSEDITVDSVRKILTISKAIDKKVFTEKPKSINLALEESFVLSIENDSSKRETKTMNIADAESTGVLHIEISTSYKNYEVQLLTTNGDLIQKVRNVKKYSFKYLQPQEYKLMLYADLNNNGQWDPQNIIARTLQEPSFFYKTPEGKFTFPIRSAWELGPLLLKF